MGLCDLLSRFLEPNAPPLPFFFGMENNDRRLLKAGAAYGLLTVLTLVVSVATGGFAPKETSVLDHSSKENPSLASFEKAMKSIPKAGKDEPVYLIRSFSNPSES